MKRFFAALLFLALPSALVANDAGYVALLASPAASLFAQQPSTTQSHTEVSREATITNADILDMVNAGVPADIIVAKITSSRCSFDTSVSAIKQLEAAKIPNGIILAMVQCPETHSQNKGKVQQLNASDQATLYRSLLGMFLVNPPSPAQGLLVEQVAASGPAARAGVRKGDFTKSLNGKPIADLNDYKERVSVLEPGTPVTLKILRGNREIEVHMTTVPPSPQLVTVVTPISSLSIPQYTTSVYQTPGTSTTSCKGNSSGNISASARPNYAGGADINGTVSSDTAANCTTTYYPPQQEEITLRRIYNYNFVEGDGYRFVIVCTANFRWSKCSSLTPGTIFPAEVKGNQMWVTATKNGDPKKLGRIKYTIVKAVPIR